MKDAYLAELRKRAKESRVYQKFQLDGLEIADILNDRAHKALYIKLAKEKDPTILRGIAKSVAERPGVKNKGALFMYLLSRPSGNNDKKKPVRKKNKPHAAKR